jgi:ATP-dependent Clp protease protease subunit
MVHLDDEKKNEEGQEKKEEGLVGELLKTRSIMVYQGIDDEIAKKVTQQLLIMDGRSQEEPITIYVNSPGGSADSGFAMYDIIRFVKAPVRTVCNGLCASAAVLVYLAGDERYTLPNSRFLLHQPRTYVQGRASDIEISAQEIVKLKRRYNEIVSGITGKDVDVIADDADRDFWLGAEDALKYGLCQKVITSQGEIS